MQAAEPEAAALSMLATVADDVDERLLNLNSPAFLQLSSSLPQDGPYPDTGPIHSLGPD